jgi:hypothetical protein
MTQVPELRRVLEAVERGLAAHQNGMTLKVNPEYSRVDGGTFYVIVQVSGESSATDFVRVSERVEREVEKDLHVDVLILPDYPTE